MLAKQSLTHQYDMPIYWLRSMAGQYTGPAQSDTSIWQASILAHQCQTHEYDRPAASITTIISSTFKLNTVFYYEEPHVIYFLQES